MSRNTAILRGVVRLDNSGTPPALIMPRLPFKLKLQKSPHSDSSDKDLITACLKGNQAAWEALIDRYLALIYSVCLKMGLAGADAEDVVQDVCVILIDHLADLRDTGKISSWIISTSKREVWRLQRRRGTKLASELGDGEWEMDALDSPLTQRAASPETAFLELEQQQMVREALGRIPERCRNLLTLLYISDEPPSYSELSTKFSLPVGSIGPTRARCLQHLRKLLTELGY